MLLNEHVNINMLNRAYGSRMTDKEEEELLEKGRFEGCLLLIPSIHMLYVPVTFTL